MSDLRSLACILVLATAACAPTLTVTLSDDRTADDEVARLLRLFQISGAEVAQQGNEVRVWTKHARDELALFPVRTALDRIIATEPVAPEPMVMMPAIDGWPEGPLRFMPKTGEIVIYGASSMIPMSSHRFCVYEVDLGGPRPDVHVGFASEYANARPGVAMQALLLEGKTWESGARGLEFAGGRGRFTFGIAAQGPVEAQLAMTNDEELRECAARVIAEASPELIARSMFPRLAETLVSYD